MNDTISSDGGGSSWDDCSIIELAEYIQRLAAIKEIERIDPNSTLVVSTPGSELLSDLRSTYTDEQATILEPGDGRIRVEYSSAMAVPHYHEYYPEDSVAFKNKVAKYDWVPGEFRFFEDLSELPSMDGQINEFATLRSGFSVLTAMEDVVAQFPDDYDDGSVQTDLGSATDWSDLSSASVYLEGWKGHAAKNFRSNYVSRFDYYQTGQAGLIAILHELLVLADTTYQVGYNDAWKIAETTIDSLEADYDSSVDSQDVINVLAMVAGVAAVIAAVPTGGASLTFFAAMGMASGALTFTGGAVSAATGDDGADEELEPYEIGGNDPEAILHSMKSTLAEARQGVLDVEEGAANWVTDLRNGMSEPSDWTPVSGIALADTPASVREAYFQPKRPSIANLSVDADASGEDVLTDAFDADYLGTTASMTQNTVTADVGYLHTAADLIMATSDDYGGFVGGLSGAGEGGTEGLSSSAQADVGNGTAYVHGNVGVGKLGYEWTQLYNLTMSILTESQQNFADISSGLNRAADAYEDLDWTNSEKLWLAGNG